MTVEDINRPDVWNSVKMHLDDLVCQYPTTNDAGTVICINLLDDGFEGGLAQSLEEAVNVYNNPALHHEHFSINRWCKKGDYKNMDILVARINPRLVGSGCFVGAGKVPSLVSNGSKQVFFESTAMQKGLLRVNCLDSLDRTNLTCTLFAKSMLSHQFNAVESLYSNHATESYLPLIPGEDPTTLVDIKIQLHSHLKKITNLWADSGDSISLLYAGTRALKSDITRTGSRQRYGLLNDGLNSLTRYYLNNFSDGKKQDIYDLLVGKITQPQLETLSLSECESIVTRIRNPVLPTFYLGKFIPTFISTRVEPLLQTSLRFSNQPKEPKLDLKSSDIHIDRQGHPNTYVGLIVSLIKKCAPEKVGHVVEFGSAMVCFFYILILMRLFEINGKVNKF